MIIHNVHGINRLIQFLIYLIGIANVFLADARDFPYPFGDFPESFRNYFWISFLAQFAAPS